MNTIGQWLVDFSGDDEVAGTAVLVAVCAVATSVVLAGLWLATARYAHAVGIAVVLGIAGGAFLRDFRRARWSVLSSVLVAVWFLLTVGLLAYGCRLALI